MRILLTNDDGIRAPGIAAALRVLRELGEVDVVAPETVQSATGHGITLATPLLTARVPVDELTTGIAVDGRPADCVKVAVGNLLPQRPNLVVSGINSGANTGINVIYSGTVAAAIEAAFLGLPAIALSLHLKREVEADYDETATHALSVIRQLLAAGLHGGDCVSVNLPALPKGKAPKGVRVVRQCTRVWQDTYERRESPRGQPYFWNTSVFSLGNTEDDTDAAAVREGYIAVTPLQFDLTARGTLARLRDAIR
jgi:5'-nucleotidase